MITLKEGDKAPAFNGKDQDGKTGDHHHLDAGYFQAVHIVDELQHGDIVGRRLLRLVIRKVPLHEINDITRDLRLKNVEIVRDNNEEGSYGQPNPVFPEIFI